LKQGDDEAEYFLVIYNPTNDDENEHTLNLYHWKIGRPFCSFGIHGNFEITRTKKYNTPQAKALSKMQVNIKLAGSKSVVGSPKIVKLAIGCFIFQYRPSRPGNYEIEVLVNRRHIKGSPFKWEAHHPYR